MVEIANQIGLRAVQLHGRGVRRGHPVGPRAGGLHHQGVPGRSRRHRSAFAEYGAQFLLIDGANPGSGEVFDWRMAEGVVDPRRLLISGGLTPENVGPAIAHLQPWGVDVATGVESSPGVKDPVKLRAFIAAATRRAGRWPVDGATGERPCPTTRPWTGPDEDPELFDWQDD